jgi:hypothetical protein
LLPIPFSHVEKLGELTQVGVFLDTSWSWVPN